MVRNIKVAAAVASVLASGAAMARFSPRRPRPPRRPSASMCPVLAAKNAILGALETARSSATAPTHCSAAPAIRISLRLLRPVRHGPSQRQRLQHLHDLVSRRRRSVTGALPWSAARRSISSPSPVQPVRPAATPSRWAVPAARTASMTPSPAACSRRRQMGITDVEPGALVGANYPSAYKSSCTPCHGLAARESHQTPIFDQVFGVFVNTTAAPSARPRS